MKRITIFIVLLCTMAVRVSSNEITMAVECGTWVEMSASSFEDYHFVRWSDGNTDSVRQVEVTADATYIAFFAANCEEYANWPVVALYDWLLMVNVRAINEMGYFLSPANVTWYRVIGEPDDMHTNFPQNDQVVVSGSYYLTLDKNLKGTGSYYAVVDVSNAQGMVCDGLMRSVIINYSGKTSTQQVALNPNYTYPNQALRLQGLNPHETTTIQVYSTAGQLLHSYTTGGEQFVFPAEGTAGCYHVRIQSDSYLTTIKYVVYNK